MLLVFLHLNGEIQDFSNFTKFSELFPVLSGFQGLKEILHQ